MATEATKDAVISTDGVPADQQANISVAENPTGTLVTNTGETQGLTATVTGPTTFTGGQFTGATFSFAPTGTDGQVPSITLQNTKFSDGKVKGAAGGDAFLVGGEGPVTAKDHASSIVVDSTTNMGKGSDSIKFSGGGEVRKTRLSTNVGADSVVFAKGSTAKNVTVGLGKDNAADVVRINGTATIKNLEIKQFGEQDVLKVGKRTYDYDQLKEMGGRVNNNIQVDFT
jgi:hypothetical protein